MEADDQFENEEKDIYIYPIRRIFGETEEVKNEEIKRKWGETKR